MKLKLKRSLASLLAISMVAGLGVTPVYAIDKDTSLFDTALDFYEEQFQETIQFNSDGTAAVMTHDEWYDRMDIVGINRERAKSQFIPYQDAETGLSVERSMLDDVTYEESQYYQLLSSTDWDFALIGTADEAAQLDDIYLAETLPDDYKATLADVYDVDFLNDDMASYLNMDDIDADTYGTFNPEYVPQAWQTYQNEDGTFTYFDEPNYTNHNLPWTSNYGNGSDYVNNINAPETDSYNPVGYYRTTFTTPADWDGREIFISFQSVESAYYLYINGEPVGYSTDSFTAHDFNLTDYLNPAGEENTLAIKIHRWSIASWLENQDFIRTSGIYRDVYLYSKDEVEIRDYFFETSFEDRSSVDSDVHVSVETDVRGLFNAQDGDYTVSISLVSDAGDTVVTADDQTVTILAAQDKSQEDVLRDRGTTVTSSFTVINPDKWFADTPTLYSLVIQLKDSTGTVLETAVDRVGFREIYKENLPGVENEQMKITGKQLVLRGVNRHDTDTETGHALTVEDYITDLTVLKSINMNAVRTSHYPNDRALYELADELGIYVCAEANIESHAASAVAPVGLTEEENQLWVATCLDRVASNLEMYKNNPSVVIWSFGNEAVYTTQNFNENHGIWVASMYTLARDPSRLRKNERTSDGYYGASYEKATGADPQATETRVNNIVDIHSTQYATPSYTLYYNSLMPFIHSEYNHAMGTSYGNAAEHWDAIRANDKAQGGFIWDYVDQSITTTRIVDGEAVTYFGYGGDWIDASHNDNAFCGNGIIYADRTISPKAVEAKKVHQQINFYLDGYSGTSATITVVNEFENTSLDAFDITWKLLEDNQVVDTVVDCGLTTAPMSGTAIGTSEELVIDLPVFVPKAGSDYILEFSATYQADTPWANAGDELAFEQFELAFENLMPQETMDESSIADFTASYWEGDNLILEGITDENQQFAISINTATGVIESYTLDGVTVIDDGPKQSYWRAETYNDTAMASTYRSEKLQNLGEVENQQNLGVIFNQSDNLITLFMSADLDMTGTEATDATGTMSYAIYGNGEIVVESSLSPDTSFGGIPKVGSRMILSSEFDNVTYYGRGPDENYVDRQSGSKVGVYATTVADMEETNLLKPQENGNRTDVRWMSLTNSAGTGLLVSASDVLEASALPYTAEELNSGTYNSADYRHLVEVPRREDTVVWNLDLKQNGVSDTAFSGQTPLDGYQVPTNQDYLYSYRITPISATTDVMAVSNIAFSAPEVEFPVTDILFNGVSLPDFDGGTFEYDVTLPIDATEIDVTATSEYPYTVERDGNLVSLTVTLGASSVVYQLTLSREGGGGELPYTVFASATANAYYSTPASYAIDGSTDTFWETDWSSNRPATISDGYIVLELTEPTVLGGINYYPRQDHASNNSVIGDYELYFSTDGSTWGTAVASGSWANSTDTKTASANDSREIQYIKLVPISTYGNSLNDTAGAAEIRVIEAGALFEGVEGSFAQESYLHTGSPVTPEPIVTMNGNPLFDGIDYTASYENNVNEGTATAIINPTASYTGDPVRVDFTINSEGAAISKILVNGTAIANFAAGTTQYDVVLPSDTSGLVVEAVSDYPCTIDYQGNTVVVTPVGDSLGLSYTLNLSRAWSVLESSHIVTATAGSEYPSTPATNAIDGNTSTIWESDWSSSLADISSAYITLELDDTYQVMGLEYFARSWLDGNSMFNEYELYFSTDGVNFGEAVATGSWELSPDNGYSPIWNYALASAPANANYVKLVPLSTYGSNLDETAGAAEISVILGTELSVDKTVVTLDVDSYPYTGQPVEPVPTVTYDGMELIEGVDFSVVYQNNTDPGSARLSIMPLGNFSLGYELSTYFTITNETPAPADVLSASLYLEVVEADVDSGISTFNLNLSSTADLGALFFKLSGEGATVTGQGDFTANALNDTYMLAYKQGTVDHGNLTTDGDYTVATITVTNLAGAQIAISDVMAANTSSQIEAVVSTSSVSTVPLFTAKLDMIASIETLEDTYLQDDYLEPEWTTLTQLFTDAVDEVKGMTSLADVEDYDLVGLKEDADAISTKDELTLLKYDLNDDGMVNYADIAVVSVFYGRDPVLYSKYDLDGNDYIGSEDYLLIYQNMT